jgi:hypothetical protein
MKILRKAKPALPYILPCLFLGAVAALHHYAPEKPGGFAQVVEQSLKD